MVTFNPIPDEDLVKMGIKVRNDEIKHAMFAMKP